MIGLARCRQVILPENPTNGFLYYPISSGFRSRSLDPEQSRRKFTLIRGTSELLGPRSLPDEFTAALVGGFTTPAIGPVDEFARLSCVNRRDGAFRGRARRDTGARAENRGNRASDHHS
jgi:hypothetical protein